jgi:hypothetical protein
MLGVLGVSIAPALSGTAGNRNKIRDSIFYRGKAFSETEKRKTGGSASAFCAPVSITSIHYVHVDFHRGNDETVSEMSATSDTW